MRGTWDVGRETWDVGRGTCDDALSCSPLDSGFCRSDSVMVRSRVFVSVVYAKSRATRRHERSACACGKHLPPHVGVPAGGTLRPHRSDASGSSVDRQQHCRRVRKTGEARDAELPLHLVRIGKRACISALDRSGAPIRRGQISGHRCRQDRPCRANADSPDRFGGAKAKRCGSRIEKTTPSVRYCLR